MPKVTSASIRRRRSPTWPPTCTRRSSGHSSSFAATTRDDLLTARTVGRAELPTTTLGLLFHAAEHSTRHAGVQAISTAKILAGS